MKKYLKPETVTSFIGLLMFVLANDIVEFTNIEAKIIMVIIGALMAFGYTIDNVKILIDKLKMFTTKKEKPPLDSGNDVIIGDTDDDQDDDIKDITIKIPPKADD